MTTPTASITQRDLRLRSKEIMDAVERGTSFTVTRGGREIAELVPRRHRRQSVSREQFAAVSSRATSVDVDARVEREGALLGALTLGRGWSSGSIEPSVGIT